MVMAANVKGIRKKNNVFYILVTKGPKKYKNQLSQFYTGCEGYLRAPLNGPSPLRKKKKNSRSGSCHSLVGTGLTSTTKIKMITYAQNWYFGREWPIRTLWAKKYPLLLEKWEKNPIPLFSVIFSDAIESNIFIETKKITIAKFWQGLRALFKCL